jgi:hypothetical protein
VHAQNVGINTVNPTENLHVRTDSSKVAIRLDNTKSVESGVNYFTAIGTPLSVQNFVIDPGYQNWTDLDYTKLVASDNTRLNSPQLSIWPDVANSLRILFDFAPVIPSNASIYDATLHIEWKRLGTFAGEMRLNNIYLLKASNATLLMDFGFTRITSSTDVQISMPFKNLYTPVTPDMLNLNDVFVSLVLLHSVAQGQSRLEIDRMWLEVEYSLPADGSENITWTTGVKDGNFLIANSEDMLSDQFLSIDETGVTQVKGLKIPKNAGEGKVLTSNNNGRAFWADLPNQETETLWLNKSDTAYYASGPVQINNNAPHPALIFDKGETRLNNGINMIETDNRILNVIIDANNDQVNEQFNIHRDSSQFLDQNPAVRLNLADQDSWINGGGNLGIGTTTPQQQLSVIGVSRAAFDSTETEYIEMRHGGNHALINTVGDGKLIIQHDNSHKMVIQDDGNVGIGFLDPTERLDVNGAIKLGDTDNPAPAGGTIKWNTISKQLEGYDDNRWRSLFDLESGDGLTRVGIDASDRINFWVNGKKVWYMENDQLVSGGVYDIAIGKSAQANNIDPYNSNIAIGYQALMENTDGSDNTAIGYDALRDNMDAWYNTAVGNDALRHNTTGEGNTALGKDALRRIETGSYNTGIGAFANDNSSNQAAVNSTGIGYDAQPGGSNIIRLGNAPVAIIGGYAGWTNVSDARVKTAVHENIVGLEFINKLRPVSYHLDMNAIASIIGTPDSLRLFDAEALKAAEIQNGFIAQEVEQAARETGFDFHGVTKPKHANDHYGLTYSEFVVPLVKAVQELSDANAELRLMLEDIRKENQQIKTQLESMIKNE